MRTQYWIVFVLLMMIMSARSVMVAQENFKPLIQVSPQQVTSQPKAQEVQQEAQARVIAPAEQTTQTIKLFTKGGRIIDLTSENSETHALERSTWTMSPDAPPILGYSAMDKRVTDCDNDKKNFYDTTCNTQYLLVRDPAQLDLKVAMKVIPNGLQVLPALRDLLVSQNWVIAVNGKKIRGDQVFPFVVPSDADAWTIEWFRKKPGCRFYSRNDEDRAAINLWPPDFADPDQPALKNNGITVGKVKLFDDAALRNMLNATATQLGALTGFNSASITSAFGNLQGVSRDTSFLSAQITTTPVPVVTATNSTALGGTASTAVSSLTPTTTTSNLTLQCPDGSLPTASGGSFGCAAIPTGSQTVTGPFSGTQSSTSTTTNPTTTQQTNGTTVSQQNGTTTTSGGFAGTVPTAPASTAFSAPANIGVGSAGILAEQVQLNAQITTLRLLLQGALSDQYLLRNSRAVAARQQTTLGFTVSLDPPRQFRHAVAEVQVVIVSRPSQDSVSIMNLLPSEKTYNVAKITSHQTSFGAGVAVSPVAVGATGGKAKDRLYIVQDTDTLAFQFPTHDEKSSRISLPWPQSLHDKVKGLVGFLTPDELRECAGNPADKSDYRNSNSVAFGWQFRPVLGADYVKGGQRQVFAQLALPTGIEQNDFKPDIFVLTRWRAYDPKRQVVGAIYHSSCSQVRNPSGITYVSKPSVYDVSVTDLGAGQLKLRAKGQFHSSGLSVLAGAGNLTPLLLDGNTIEVFGNAHDLLEAGDLMIVGQNGTNLPFGIETDRDDPSKHDRCGIESATLHAIPYPDGNSRADLKFTLKEGYSSEDDGKPKPLVLVSNQVYGVKEAPFTKQDCKGKPLVCTYRFVAPTSDVRNAQRFLVKDLAWDDLQKDGDVDFFPMFTGLAISSTYPQDPDTPPPPTAPKPDTTTFYEIAGYDFDKLHPCPLGKMDYSPILKIGDSPNSDWPCLTIFIGNEDKTAEVGFTVVSKNLATMSLSKKGLGNAKGVRFLLAGTKCIDDPQKCIDDLRVEWDLPLPKTPVSDPTPSVQFLRVSDSRVVTFSGGDVSKIDEKLVTFETKPVTAKFSKPDSLAVFITTEVTKTPGHKELTAIIKGTTKTVQLPIEVLK